jgi:protein-tyrosine-phosphatase
MKLRILFVCATNGLQSPMAETILRRLDSEHFEATSAGIERGATHPLARDVMNAVGIDLDGKPTKTVRDLNLSGFDFVITMCDRARFECPNFAGAQRVHWRLDNPLMEADQAKQKRMFESLRDQITQRVRLFALVQARPAASEKRESHQVPLTA